jgi:hypothetical protein
MSMLSPHEQAEYTKQFDDEGALKIMRGEPDDIAINNRHSGTESKQFLAYQEETHSLRKELEENLR